MVLRINLNVQLRSVYYITKLINIVIFWTRSFGESTIFESKSTTLRTETGLTETVNLHNYEININLNVNLIGQVVQFIRLLNYRIIKKTKF